MKGDMTRNHIMQTEIAEEQKTENIGMSSSSSSNTVQGSVSLPHYRTLEVRPGRIS